MPLYEYVCRSCNDQFELLIRGSETPTCPQCSSGQLERLLSVPAAPQAGAKSLPVCRPRPAGGCGLPQCGSGGCMMD